MRSPGIHPRRIARTISAAGAILAGTIVIAFHLPLWALAAAALFVIGCTAVYIAAEVES